MDRSPLLASIAAGIATLLLPAAVLALEVPTLERRVNDRAGLLSLDARASLEQELARYETTSGHQFAVLTVPSLAGEALEDFSVRVAQQWRLGRKGRDDGLLLLVVGEPHAIRVEVGYGLEPTITDALSGRVIRNIIGPAFRAGDYAGGIRRGLERLMWAASSAGETGGEHESARASAGTRRWSKGQKAALLLVLMFLGPLVAVLVFAGIFMAFNRGGRLNHLLGPAPDSGSSAGGTAPRDSSSGGSSDDSSSSSSSGGDFSGGGGSFGGGGASGSW